VTAADVGRPAGQAPASRRAAGPKLAGLRLARLHAASRHVLTCLVVLAACAVALRIALHWLPRSGVYARQIPLTIEAGAAAVIGVTTGSPFGEPERATGRWLPWLRLGGVILLTAAAAGALAAGATGGLLPGGTLAMLRNLAGMTGVGLLAAVAIGGAFGWIGPMAYWLVTEGALAGGWTTPWEWPTRPPHDLGGALCAYGVFAAGLVAITLLGARDPSRRPAPE